MADLVRGSVRGGPKMSQNRLGGGRWQIRPPPKMVRGSERSFGNSGRGGGGEEEAGKRARRAEKGGEREEEEGGGERERGRKKNEAKQQ